MAPTASASRGSPRISTERSTWRREGLKRLSNRIDMTVMGERCVGVRGRGARRLLEGQRSRPRAGLLLAGRGNEVALHAQQQFDHVLALGGRESAKGFRLNLVRQGAHTPQLGV